MGLFGRKREKYSPVEREKMGLKVAAELPRLYDEWYQRCVKAVRENKPNLVITSIMTPSCQRSIKAFSMVHIAHLISSRKYFNDMGREFTVTLLTNIFKDNMDAGTKAFGEFHNLINDQLSQQHLIRDKVTACITNNNYDDSDALAVEWKIIYLQVMIQVLVFSTFRDDYELSNLPSNIPTAYPELEAIKKMANDEIEKRKYH